MLSTTHPSMTKTELKYELKQSVYIFVYKVRFQSYKKMSRALCSREAGGISTEDRVIDLGSAKLNITLRILQTRKVDITYFSHLSSMDFVINLVKFFASCSQNRLYWCKGFVSNLRQACLDVHSEFCSVHVGTSDNSSYLCT